MKETQYLNKGEFKGKRERGGENMQGWGEEEQGKVGWGARQWPSGEKGRPGSGGHLTNEGGGET